MKYVCLNKENLFSNTKKIFKGGLNSGAQGAHGQPRTKKSAAAAVEIANLSYKKVIAAVRTACNELLKLSHRGQPL